MGNPTGGDDGGSGGSKNTIAFAGISGYYNYLFYQKNGAIWMAKYNGSWSHEEVIPSYKVRNDTPLATLNWDGNFRVYYLSPSDQVHEWCWDSNGSKYDGALNYHSARAADNSKLSAIRFRGQIRVYYQGSDRSIEEYCYSDWNSWSKGATLPGGNAVGGTDLAFINRNGDDASTPSIRGYYQNNSLNIQEVCWDGSWNLGMTIGDGPLGTSITATTAIVSGTSKMEVYWIGSDHAIWQQTWYHGWSSGTRIATSGIAEGSKLNAKAIITDSDIDVRLWAAVDSNTLRMRRFVDGRWRDEHDITVT